MNDEPTLIDLCHGEQYPLVLAVKNQFIAHISAHHEVDSQLVLPNNGSNGSLLTVISAIDNHVRKLNKTPTLVIDTPNYFRTMHLAREYGYSIHKVPRDEQMDFDCAAFIDTIRKVNPSLVVLTTPNNPTGKSIPDDYLRSVLDELGPNSVALIDRTLVNLDPEISSLELLSTYASTNVLILHSFSKSHGLSQERVGYALASNFGLAQVFRGKLNLGFNVGALSAGMAALNDEAALTAVKKRLTESLDILAAAEISGVTYFPSRSNYGLIMLPESYSAGDLSVSLRKSGIAVMDGNEIALGDRYIRIHMTGEEAMKRFVGHLRDFVNSPPTTFK